MTGGGAQHRPAGGSSTELPTNDAPLLRPSQLARFWELNARTLHEWIRAGRLAAVRTPGNHFRLRVADVRAFCERENMPVPEFVVARARRVLLVGGDAALARTVKLALAKQGVTLEHMSDPWRALVRAALAPPVVSAFAAKAELAARALLEAPIDPKPRVVVFDVVGAAKCAALTRAGATKTLTRSRATELAALLADLATS